MGNTHRGGGFPGLCAYRPVMRTWLTHLTSWGLWSYVFSFLGFFIFKEGPGSLRLPGEKHHLRQSGRREGPLAGAAPREAGRRGGGQRARWKPRSSRDSNRETKHHSGNKASPGSLLGN